jgi:hypothetical protein
MLKRLVPAAALLIASAPAAFAVDIPITNGDFQNPADPPIGYSQNFTNWTTGFTPDNGETNTLAVVNSFGLFTSFGGISNGTKFAQINNLGAGTVSLQSSVFNTLGMPFIGGQFAYFTSDAADVAVRDAFTVELTFYTDMTGTTQVGPAMTFTPNAGPLSNSTFAETQPFVTGRFAGTGFQSFGITIPPITQFARIRFIVDDSGTESGINNSGATGVLLDNIVLNPEPGTWALFGLGALGLGAAIRRRKLAIAKAAADSAESDAK